MNSSMTEVKTNGNEIQNDYKLSNEMMNTLSITQTPDEEEKEEIEEDNLVTIPFGFQNDECDVWFKTKTGTLRLPSNYVKWISKELQTVMMASDEKENGEKSEIQLLEFSSESVIQVISFYHPKDFVPLKGKFHIQL